MDAAIEATINATKPLKKRSMFAPSSTKPRHDLPPKPIPPVMPPAGQAPWFEIFNICCFFFKY